MNNLYELINKIGGVYIKAKRNLLMGLMIIAPLTSYAAFDADAATVHLRFSCSEGGKVIDNCYEATQAKALFTWITDVRKPKAVSPLTVKIGEGQFLFDQITYAARQDKMNEIVLYCDGPSGFEGYITFQGAGRSATTIGYNGGYTLNVDACEGLTFKDLKLSGYGNSGGLVRWTGGGSSVWENVDTDSQFSTWSSRAGTCGAVRGKHYWFASRISNHHVFNHAVGYQEECDESWFFGTEIQNTATSGGTGNAVFSIKSAGEVHVYGGVIRSNATGQLNLDDALKAVEVSGGGNIHIHGTGIDVISTTANDIIVFDVGAGGVVHAMESAYNLSTAEGTRTRIKNNGGTANASYLWQSGAEAPDIVSVTGADTAMITNTSDGHPHQVVYDSSCSSSWYDTTINACR